MAGRTEHWEIPMIQYKGRHSEFMASDVYDEACVEAAVLSSGYSAWPIPHDEWHDQFPSGVTIPTNVFLDAQTGQPPRHDGELARHQELEPLPPVVVQAPRLRRLQPASGPVAVRRQPIQAYMSMEGSQIWDWAHPDAFKNDHVVFDNVDVMEEDALANIASLTDSGAVARPLLQHLLARVRDDGGRPRRPHRRPQHAEQQRLPEDERLQPGDQPLGCPAASPATSPTGSTIRAAWRSATRPSRTRRRRATAATGNPGSFAGVTSYMPGGDQLVNPPIGAPTWGPNCDQRNRDDVDPIHPTNPRYQRWYPSGITLPDNRMVVYGGDDLDESVGPERGHHGLQRRVTSTSGTRASSTRCRRSTTSTRSARFPSRTRARCYGLYPAATVVEIRQPAGRTTGSSCAFTGEPAPGERAPPGPEERKHRRRGRLAAVLHHPGLRRGHARDPADGRAAFRQRDCLDVRRRRARLANATSRPRTTGRTSTRPRTNTATAAAWPTSW